MSSLSPVARNSTPEISPQLQALAEAFSKCREEAQIRLCGRLVGFDKKTLDVFIKTYGKPTRYLGAARFAALMTHDEARRLEGVPNWNGHNAHQISRVVLGVVEDVFAREHRCC